MSVLLVGTGDGLWTVEEDGSTRQVAAASHTVTAVTPSGDTGWLALVDRREVWAGGEVVATLPAESPAGTCVVAAPGGTLVGTAEAHLLRVVAPSGVEIVSSFEEAEGRDSWYTPWGGPPDTRSLSVAGDGTVYVNVHVGGILRSEDGGDKWTPTIDVDADVHQVLAVADGPVVAATAYGLATSADLGSTWTFSTSGLHADYSRAVAVAGDWLLLSASTGPSTTRAALYRRPLSAGDGEAFERCTAGLPEWFPANVDTGSLVAGPEVAVVASEGSVFTSTDGGATWRQAASGLGRITCLALVRAHTTIAASVQT